MAKKDYMNFMESSLEDLATSSAPIETKTNEITSIVNKKKSEEPVIVKTKIEKDREDIAPSLRKIIKKAEDLQSDSTNAFGSIRLDKTLIHELKTFAVKIDVPAYKLVSVMIQDFLEKNSQKEG